MQRMIDSLGYTRVIGVMCEASCRVPSRVPPADVHAAAVWAKDLPGSVKGMTFGITGTSSGMGFELGKKIAERGGNLILMNRTSAHAEKACAELKQVAGTSGGDAVQIACDLCDFDSVRSAAAKLRSELTSRGWFLDALVLNAGLMAQNDIRTKDGYDIQMQANHLSHFLLTSLVFDLLEQAAQKHGEARVVSHSSGARRSPDAPLQQDAFEKAWAQQADGKPNPCQGDSWPGMGKWKRYQQSKRCNLAFTYALSDHIAARPGCGVKALCAHPGATNSGLQSRTKGSTWLDNFINGLAATAGHSSADGCLALAIATLKKDLSSGDFFGPLALVGKAELLACEREGSGAGPGYPSEQLRLLWDKSVEATGAQWSK